MKTNRELILKNCLFVKDNPQIHNRLIFYLNKYVINLSANKAEKDLVKLFLDEFLDEWLEELDAFIDTNLKMTEDDPRYCFDISPQLTLDTIVRELHFTIKLTMIKHGNCQRLCNLTRKVLDLGFYYEFSVTDFTTWA